MPGKPNEQIIDEEDLALDRYDGNIFVITMRKAPENRINSKYGQKLIGAFNKVREILGTSTEGAVVTKGNDAKFWCTGLELDEADSNPFANAEGFYPLVMNSKRGFISMPPVDLGLHFPGIGALPRLKLQPRIARKMLLEAHRWTGKEALEDGVVDAVADPEHMFDVAMEMARKWAPKAKMDVYGVLRSELYGEAGRHFREIAFNYGRRPEAAAKARI